MCNPFVVARFIGSLESNAMVGNRNSLSIPRVFWAGTRPAPTFDQFSKINYRDWVSQPVGRMNLAPTILKVVRIRFHVLPISP